MILALLLAASPVPPTLDAWLGPAVSARRVAYRDRLTPALAGYESGARLGASLTVSLYPASGRGLPVVSDVGFVGSFTRSLPSPTVTRDGATALLATSTLWDAGLRWRALVDGVDRLGVSLRYVSLRDDFDGALPGVLLPSGETGAWAPGVDGRLSLGPAVLSASASWLGLVSHGAFGDAFPRETAGGVDASAALSLDLGRHVAARLALRYARVFAAFHPLPHDPYVAGGATDETVQASLAVALRL